MTALSDLEITSPWFRSYRGEPEAVSIADRHYNRQKIGSPQFVPPGRCLVLRSASALWVTSWPFAEYVRHAWPGAWVNSLFRREGGARASEQIRFAVAHTLSHWPEPPELGMVTFVDPKKVKPIYRRGKPIFGYCYLKAGFKARWLYEGRIVGMANVAGCDAGCAIAQRTATRAIIRMTLCVAAMQAKP